MQTVREPAVAGFFYPGDRDVLADQVDGYLAGAAVPDKYSRLLIAPHAGYDYSGSFAAEAYRALDPEVHRILILGPTHRVGIAGMALAGADAHATPLGLVETDPELTSLLERLPGVVTSPVVHAQEHSLEVHLPFLQRVLDNFTVVPLAVGNASAKDVARVIEKALDLPGTAVVVSSDLSHYNPVALARELDKRTVAQILNRAEPLSSSDACGVFPVNGLMHFANDRGWEGELLSLGNSADTAGDDRSVVGYASIAWYPQADGDGLLGVARKVLGDALDVQVPETGSAAEGDDSPGASFVTLSMNGQLRGCIGSLQPVRGLVDDVAANAKAAAFGDPRFPPLTPGELPSVDIQVSVLSSPEYLVDGPAEEEPLLAMLKPGVHGVVWTGGGGHATFLPQVWGQLPEPAEFLRQLKRKAGVPEDYWGQDVRLQVYTVASTKGPALPDV